MNEKRILIGYDGSDGAKRALAFAANYFGGSRAVVVTAFEDAAPTAGGHPPASPRPPEAMAEEGAALAREAGIEAEARAVHANESAWRSIIAVADEVGAGVIVVGSHGFNGLRPLVLGSVSHQLGHHAHQPVVVVPTQEAVAARRAQKAQSDTKEHVHH